MLPGRTNQPAAERMSLMVFHLPPLYPITDTRLSGLPHSDQVARLIDGGASLIQIRDKHCTPDELYRAAIACIALARPRGVKIVVNDRADVALAADADGVHLGQDDLPAEEARALLGTSRVVGISTHTLEQAIEAANLPVDYVAIGPAFSTSTKANPDPVVGLDLITEVSSRIDKPLVAIGGITLERGPSAIAAGAHSVAVISDLYTSGDIVSRTAEFLRLLAR
jgi:thiamine-phosphate pyrophosphorylase